MIGSRIVFDYKDKIDRHPGNPTMTKEGARGVCEILLISERTQVGRVGTPEGLQYEVEYKLAIDG